jgi:hypothetical protein
MATEERAKAMGTTSTATVGWVNGKAVLVSIEEGQGAAWGSIAVMAPDTLDACTGDVLPVAMLRGREILVEVLGQDPDSGGYAIRQK